MRMDDSSPMMDHGSMLDGARVPPASKPLLLTSSAHIPPAPAWLISAELEGFEGDGGASD